MCAVSLSGGRGGASQAGPGRAPVRSPARVLITLGCAPSAAAPPSSAASAASAWRIDRHCFNDCVWDAGMGTNSRREIRNGLRRHAAGEGARGHSFDERAASSENFRLL